MAERKSPPSASGKAAAKATAKLSGSRSSASSRGPAKAPAARPAGRPPVKKKPGKSIVNQKQRPWGLIITTIVIVLFAGGIVAYAVSSGKGSSNGADANNPYTQPEVAAAKAIPGVQWKAEPNHSHVFSKVSYDTSPPTGGNHSQIWADCSGTVYPNAIANENATHMLEHGAVWITYKPGLAASEVSELAKLVNGVDRMAMSPYPGLKTNISLQAWGYQLFVDSASDPRIEQFIGAVRQNPKVDPEQGSGVTCSDPQFKQKPSTFGNPIFTFSS